MQSDGPVLVVELTNLRNRPIRVDKELVFLLYVLPYPRTVDLVETGKRISRLPPLEVHDRIITLGCGESVRRTIRLTAGFKLFRYGVGRTTDSMGRVELAPYEATYKITGLSGLKCLRVYYGADPAFAKAFRKYTGVPLQVVRLYEGPVVVCVPLPKSFAARGG